MAFRNVHDGIHIGALAKQMHRHDSLCARSDSLLNCNRINAIGVHVDIHHHWCETQQSDHLSCRDESERSGDDLVARFQAETHHSHLQSVGAIGARNHMFYIEILLQIFLEFLYKRTADETASR